MLAGRVSCVSCVSFVSRVSHKWHKHSHAHMHVLTCALSHSPTRSHMRMLTHVLSLAITWSLTHTHMTRNGCSSEPYRHPHSHFPPAPPRVSCPSCPLYAVVSLSHVSRVSGVGRSCCVGDWSSEHCRHLESHVPHALSVPPCQSCHPCHPCALTRSHALSHSPVHSHTLARV